MPSYRFTSAKDPDDSYVTDVQVSSAPITYADVGVSATAVALTTDQAREFARRWNLVQTSPLPADDEFDDDRYFPVYGKSDGTDLRVAGTAIELSAESAVFRTYSEWDSADRPAGGIVTLTKAEYDALDPAPEDTIFLEIG